MHARFGPGLVFILALNASPALAGRQVLQEFAIPPNVNTGEKPQSKIVKVLNLDVYLVIQVAQQLGPQNECTTPELPCWLRWNEASLQWVEAKQPPVTSLCTSGCRWYVDVQNSGSQDNGQSLVVAAYHERTTNEVILLTFQQNASTGIDFNSMTQLPITTAASGSDSYAAVTMDQTGCAYVHSNAENGAMREMRVWHVAPPYTSIYGGTHHLVDGNVLQNDAGDLTRGAPPGTPPGPDISFVYSNQNLKRFRRSTHTVFATPCFGSWSSPSNLFETIAQQQFDAQSGNMADGHVSLIAGVAGVMGVVKTGPRTGGMGNSVIGLFRFGDEDFYVLETRSSATRPVVSMKFDSYSPEWEAKIIYRIGGDIVVRQPMIGFFTNDSDSIEEMLDYDTFGVAWPDAVFTGCEQADASCQPNATQPGSWNNPSTAAQEVNDNIGEHLWVVASRAGFAHTARIVGDDGWSCSDHFDNDFTGGVDLNDAGCGIGFEFPQCHDGADNDGDSKIDFPSDPQCGSATDTGEGASGCGLGFELALVLPLLAIIRCRLSGSLRRGVARTPHCVSSVS